MDLRNCSRCGKLFAFQGHQYCRDCLHLEEQDFLAVRNHLKENPRLTLDELHEQTGVSRDRILRFMRDGRLVASGSLEGMLRCEQCGMTITSGHYCRGCMENLNSSIDRVAPRPNASLRAGASKMHISDRIRDRRN